MKWLRTFHLTKVRILSPTCPSQLTNIHSIFTDKTLVQKSKDIIEELNVLERTFFGKDRVKVIRAKLDEGVALLDSKPIDLGKLPPHSASNQSPLQSRTKRRRQSSST